MTTQTQQAPNGLVKFEPVKIIEGRKEALQAFIPEPKDLDRFIRSAAFAIAQGGPRLRACTPASIQRSVVTAAELRLDLARQLGLAYLVPYRKGKGKDAITECQLQIGYRGFIALAGRSGITIDARLVFDTDEFREEAGTTGLIHHVPTPLNQPRGRGIGAYAVATFPDGHKQSLVMRFEDLEAIRTRSQSADDGPWRTDPDEMYRKCPVRRLCKYLNLNSPDMATALEADNEDTDLSPREPAQGSNTQRLNQVLGTGAQNKQAATQPQGPQPGIGDENAQPPDGPTFAEEMEQAEQDVDF